MLHSQLCTAYCTGIGAVAAVHAAGLRWFRTDAGSERSFTRKAASRHSARLLFLFNFQAFLRETVKVR
jgi:hypothetical protein